MNWIGVKEKLPLDSWILRIKRANGDESKAYFHADKMVWLSYYTKDKLSHFQDCKSLEFLYDVTHWCEIKKENG
jgi:hypothetical protein